jgi:predicted enzyme related to lactoylglutathione lyase
VTFDCADPDRLVAFWSAALGYTAHGHTVHPPNGGLYLEFCVVPESKTVKNRAHIGFSTDDVDAEIARLTELGASVAWEEEFPDEWAYRNVILRDPEGNEFCLGGPR